jgi:Lrp/AsnC family leucine-responsive transcriptional regulator
VDEIDLKIVRLLHSNGRISHEQLAREVHLSRPAVHERVKRLEEEGVLQGYRALVNWGEVGLPITAFIWVRTVGVKSREPGKAIMGLTGDAALVEECHRVAGEWCLLVKARAASPLALESLLDDIRDLPGVDVTMTTIVLSTLTEDVRLQPNAPPPGSEHTHLSLAREAS